MYIKYEEQSLLIDSLIHDAELYIMQFDRSQYEPFFRVVESYLSAHGGILGSNIAEKLLSAHRLGKTPVLNHNSFSYKVYLDPAACNPINWTRGLADKMGEVDSPLSRTVCMTTTIYRLEFNIAVNTRPCVQIIVMSPVRGRDQFAQITKPARVRGYYGTKLHVLDAEMLLANIYRELHRPTEVGEWSEFARRELDLASTVVEDVSKKIFGGNTDYIGIPWFKLSGVIWVGDPAVAFHKSGKLSPEFNPVWRPQIITSTPIDDIIVMIEKIMPRIGGKKLTYVQMAPGVAGDPQLIKTTIIFNSRSILDVYNTSAYDLVPYTMSNGRMIAGVWLTLRMLFTDLWILRTVQPSKYIEDRIYTVLHGINIVRGVAWKDLVGVSSNIEYTGNPKSDNDARRELIMTGQRMPPYYPAVVHGVSKNTKKGGDSKDTPIDCDNYVDLPPFIGPFGTPADPVAYSAAFLPSIDCATQFLSIYKSVLLVRSTIQIRSAGVDRISPVCCVDDGPDLLDELCRLTGPYDFVHLNGVLHHVNARLINISAELKRIAPAATIIISDIDDCPRNSLERVNIPLRKPPGRMSTVALAGAMASQGYSKVLFEYIAEQCQFVFVFRG